MFYLGLERLRDGFLKDLKALSVVYIFCLTLSSSSEELYLLMVMGLVGGSVSGLKKLLLALLQDGAWIVRCRKWLVFVLLRGMI